MPWRVYRPAIVVGHSETGAMDKIDGPYYFFPLLKLLRDALPAWLPLVGVDLGDTNVVPGRLRRLGDGPPGAPARPRRRGVPPRQPRAAAGGRGHQPHLRRRRRARASPPRSTAASPPPDRSAWSPAPCAPRPSWRRRRPLRAGAAGARPDARAGRDPGGGARPHQLHRRLRLAPYGEGAGRLRHRGARPGVLRPHAVGLLGGPPRPGDRTRPRHPRGAPGQARRHHRRLVRHRPGHRAQGRPGRRRPGARRPRQGQARGDPGDDRDARRPGARLRLRPLRPRVDRPALRAGRRPTCPRSTSSSTTPAARSAARCGCRRTASTTSSAPCSSTTSARSGW